MTDFRGLLEVLAEAGVDFILVGGVAATVHGSSRLTQDVDVVYSRSHDNLRRLVEALADHEPYPRGAPPGLPFRFDEATLQAGLNFTLTTKIGDVDLLGEIVGGRTYEDLAPHTIEVNVFGLRCRCLDLETLIRVKRAAGRPKDLEAISELEVILDELGKSRP
jgi:predicted nucleotidyltransferase